MSDANNDELEVVEVEDDRDEQEPAITEPGKLMRIALMLREMQEEEVRRADMDAAGRDRLRVVHDRAIDQLKSVLNADLSEELDTLALPFEEDTPTESEIRVAQAQLIGWLEGLFQGIQAAIMNQQMAARAQLEHMARRGLPAHAARPLAGGEERPRGASPGQYL